MAIRSERWVGYHAAQMRIAERLRGGEELEAIDMGGSPVRVKHVGDDCVLLFGDEPAWRGDAKSIARFFVRATGPHPELRRV